MATFRVGVGSFNIQDGAVGFGTDTDGLGNLKVKGVTKTTDIKVSGASTLTRYSGFAADNINQLENITLTSEVGTIGDIVVGVGTSVIISSGSTVTVGTVESVSIGTHFSPPTGGIEERGQDFVEGMMRFNTDLNTMEFYNGNEWRQFNYQLDIKSSPSSRGRVLIVGGRDSGGTRTSDIKFVNISTLGNSLHFGNLNVARRQVGSCGSEIRALTMGGSSAANDSINEIHYYTTASGGDAIDFGDLLGAKQSCSALSSSTRGVSYSSGGTPYNQIDYVEIATLGNALDFGDAAVASRMGAPASSPVRGFKTGGILAPTNTAVKEFITISSKGNGTEFGTAQRGGPGGKGASNNVRAVIAGGYSYISPYPSYSDIEYFNMTSFGDSTNFGDLGRKSKAAGFGNSANQVRALFTGGYTDGSTYTDKIDYITFATTGNALDFGNLSISLSQTANTSDSHGGLGGY